MKGSFESYPNGVSVAVEPGDEDSQDNGARRLEISLDQPVSRMRGVVGIRKEALCPQTQAQVSIEDGDGRRLFSAEVSRSGPQRFDVSVQGVTEVFLLQSSLGSGEGCTEANPAWGGVEFVKAA